MAAASFCLRVLDHSPFQTSSTMLRHSELSSGVSCRLKSLGCIRLESRATGSDRLLVCLAWQVGRQKEWGKKTGASRQVLSAWC
jgi:hypothetical protein